MKRDLRDPKEVNHMIGFIRGSAMKASNVYKNQVGNIDLSEKDIPRDTWIRLTKEEVISYLLPIYSLVGQCTEEEISIAFDRAVAKYGKVPYIDEPLKWKLVNLGSCLTTLLILGILIGGSWFAYQRISPIFRPKSNNSQSSYINLAIKEQAKGKG
jgi:cbb3-type cytochrome oxidase subunit 3